MSCKICTKSLHELFEAQLLGKYQSKYYQCANCGFIQTEDPYWLEEAYASAITNLDLGYATRNIKFAEVKFVQIISVN